MWGRRLASAAIGVAGTFGVLVLVLVMNAGTTLSTDDDGSAETAFDVPPPPPPKPKKQPKPKPKKRKKRNKAPPAPIVGANLGGLSFGLEGLGDAALAAGADSLLGDVDNVVMTEDSVDDPPKPVSRKAPQYPDRARKKGISGRVVLSVLIDASGNVSDVRVVESEPPGVFDEAAVAAVKTWRFQPAMYEGNPVAIRVTQPLSFGFE